MSGLVLFAFFLQEPLSLGELEEMALRNQPALRQAALDVEASRARAEQAGTFPNPTFGYTAEEVSSGPIIRWGEHGFFAEQTIPLAGKLGRGRAVFEREAARGESLAALQEHRVRSTVRTLFYQALTTERRIEVLERLSLLAFEAEGTSRQLYNVGLAGEPDVLESELEARLTRLDLTAARNHRFAVWRRLAAVVGDPSLEPRPLEGDLDTGIPELDRETIRKEILERSPEVLAARAELERSQAVVALAEREKLPDLFLRGGLGYNRELLELGGEPVGWEGAFEAGVSVPLFDRNEGAIGAARAEQSRAELELRRIELSIESRLASAFEEYLTALRAAELYRAELLPRAERAYLLYLSRYREMAVEYPRVLMAQRTHARMNEEYLQYLERAWRAALSIQGFLLEEI